MSSPSTVTAAAAASSSSTVVPQAWTVGYDVSYTLQSGASGTGRVFAVDPVGHRVFLDVDNHGVLLLNLDAVSSASFSHNPAPIEPLPALTPAMASAREKQAFRAQEERLLKAGPHGTSKLEQEIFDTLSKTLDCRWNGHTIEEKKLGVTIKAPFRASDVSGRDHRAVQRVQSILSKIRERIDQQSKVVAS